MRWWWQPPCLLRTVIVNLKGDESVLQGVLWGMRGPWLVLRHPTLVRPGQSDMPADGEVVVHRETVSFIQVL